MKKLKAFTPHIRLTVEEFLKKLEEKNNEVKILKSPHKYSLPKPKFSATIDLKNHKKGKKATRHDNFMHKLSPSPKKNPSIHVSLHNRCQSSLNKIKVYQYKFYFYRRDVRQQMIEIK